MTGEVGVLFRAGNAAKKRHVRLRRADEQHQQGGQSSEKDALQNAQQQHGTEGNRRGVEVQPAHAPHVQQRRKIQ